MQPSLSIYKTIQQMVLLLQRFNSAYVWFGGVWFGGVWFGLTWFINVLHLSNITYSNFADIYGYFRTKYPVGFLG